MFLLEWTASDLLMMALAASVMIGTVLWLVPSARVPANDTIHQPRSRPMMRRFRAIFWPQQWRCSSAARTP
ncbi:MAG: hypothetical protein R2911_41360 [Caldilineaceae bacterium]